MIRCSGKGGNDTLYGGSGHDIFQLDSISIDDADSIVDFNIIDDTIQLEHTIFTAFNTTGAVNSANFVVGSAPVDTNDYLIYNKSTGALIYDADGAGVGTGMQIATLGVNLNLSSANVVII